MGYYLRRHLDFDLKTTLLAGQQLISYGKPKFDKVCLVVFAVVVLTNLEGDPTVRSH